jgi:hypothetical protein
MLARSAVSIPAIGYLYEPKLDGFTQRGLAVARARSGSSVTSNGTAARQAAKTAAAPAASAEV